MIRSCPQIFTGSKHTNQSYKKKSDSCKVASSAKRSHSQSFHYIYPPILYLSIIINDQIKSSRERNETAIRTWFVSFLRRAFLQDRQLNLSGFLGAFIQRGTLSTRIGVRAKSKTARVPWSRDPRRLRLLDLVPLLARLPPPPSLLRSPMFRVNCTARARATHIFGWLEFPMAAHTSARGTDSVFIYKSAKSLPNAA